MRIISLNPSISIQLLFICLFLRKALVFTLHDFTPDFHSLTFFWKSLTNAQNPRQIGARLYV